ncbi:hypothetical protein B0H16DRAFT_1756520 [Mycena metata]|uniref:No apical meristem-associated C-terminal domain-containing protein n=1 Tax=Mycena metata TaxID=1033252 RepID=A0AAD7JZX2_9AGAR|nr:hypothetical protein B0H16DRAFT_1756520 [Mycena metata]
MAKISRAFDSEMGQTGAGIQHASEIDMSKANTFTTKWAEISAGCPWYFEMRNLIGQRPNLVPTGVGNSSSTVAAGVIIPAAGATAPSPTATIHDVEEEGEEEEEDTASSVVIDGWDETPPPPKRKFADFVFDDDVATPGSEDNYSPSSPVASESAGAPMPVDDEEEDVEDAPKQKSKTPKAEETRRKTNAKPSTSTPALPIPTAVKPSKKTKITEFSELAKNEEKTRQKELELAALRTRQQMKATEVKGRIIEKKEERRRQRDEAKQAERMLRLKMKVQRQQNEHALRMATAMGSGPLSSTSHAGDSFFDTHSLSSASRYTPSDAADYGGDFDALSTNAFAGPSNSTDLTDYSQFASGSGTSTY